MRHPRHSHPAKPRRRPRPGRAAAIAGTAIAAAGASILAAALLAPPPAPAAPAAAPPTAPAAAFDAAAPDTYTGTPTTAPDLPPSTLAIPDLGLQMPIIDTAVDTHGYLGIPDSDKAAHYTASAPLGSPTGSVFIAAHANYPNGAPAPMGAIARLAKGTPVYATDTNGTPHRYKTATLTTLPKTSLPPALANPAGPAQLVLVTCDLTSPWLPIAGVEQYADNTIATATPWP